MLQLVYFLFVVDESPEVVAVSPDQQLHDTSFEACFLYFYFMNVDEHPVQFFTAVCYDWLKLLESDAAKQIVIEALKYRVKVGQVKVSAFVIMPKKLAWMSLDF